MSYISILDFDENEICVDDDIITKILTVLNGNCKLYKEIMSETFECSTQYIFPQNEKLFSIISDELTEDEFNRFKIIILRNNESFFQEFFNEICEYMIAQNQNQYTKAFIFIYRLLEHISYAFPMLYVAKSNDFKGTYDSIRDWAKGEPLNFFSNFINKIFSKYDKENYKATINLPANDKLQEKYSSLFKQKVFFGKNENYLIKDECEEKTKIVFKWTFIPALIITLRNGFCHYLNSERPNLLNVDDFIDSDLFFMNITDECMKWIATVFVEILTESYGNTM